MLGCFGSSGFALKCVYSSLKTKIHFDSKRIHTLCVIFKFKSLKKRITGVKVITVPQGIWSPSIDLYGDLNTLNFLIIVYTQSGPVRVVYNEDYIFRGTIFTLTPGLIRSFSLLITN